jgi:transposase
MCVRTYAPVGETPILRVPLTRDHLSAIGGITPEGRMFMQMQEHAYCAQDVVAFLRLLLRKIPGKLLVIWDGAPIHRAKVIKEFLANGAAKRLHLERLPGYAPELNPQEGVWNAAQTPGVKKPVLPASVALAPVSGAGQRTPSSSAGDPPIVFSPFAGNTLATYAEISKGLGEIIIGPQIETTNFIPVLSTSRQDDDRDGREFTG